MINANIHLLSYYDPQKIKKIISIPIFVLYSSNLIYSYFSEYSMSLIFETPNTFIFENFSLSHKNDFLLSVYTITIIILNLEGGY